VSLEAETRIPIFTEEVLEATNVRVEEVTTPTTGVDETEKV
jgi:hypothetical protein